jgi:hypothetical protein
MKRLGQRVRINNKHDSFPEFHGQVGTIIDSEMDGKRLYRVEFDQPVKLKEFDDRVVSDLWAGRFLKNV